MKKWLLLLFVLSMLGVSAALAEEDCPITFQMELSQTWFDGPQEVEVTIIVTNESGEDMPGPLALYWPNGKIIEEFGMPTLKAGETRTWEGRWTVTEEQLKQGRVIFAIQYLAKGADGSSLRKMQPYYVPVMWTEPKETKPQHVKIDLAGASSSGYSWDWGLCNGRLIVDIACEVSESGDACYTLTGMEAGETTICFTYDEAWYTERDPNFARYAIYYDIRVDEEMNVSILNTEFCW